MSEIPANYYIDNKAFYQKIVDFHAAKTLNPNLRVPESIGKDILAIATHMATRGNFSGYSFRDDMIGDGILDALKAIRTFDPAKSANPFGYMSKIIMRAYFRRIQKENKERTNRMSLMHEDISSFDIQDHDDKADFTMQDWG